MTFMLLYLGVCILVGFLGRRSIGFWGGFFGSLVLTPLGMAIVLLIVFAFTRKRGDKEAANA